MQNVLVTGGAGFIGSNFIHCLLAERPGARVVNYDVLTYAGNLENVAHLESSPSYTFVRGNICDGRFLLETLKQYQIDTIFHFAAESHVDRSILSGAEFVQTNVMGTQTILETAIQTGIQRLIHISTDEVYGSLGEEGSFSETSPLAPNSPYSASKASSDLLVRAYFHTFGFPAIITRCSNNYGPWQFPEKLIPLMIIKALNNEELPVYGDGKNVRDWIHVQDHCHAVLAAAERGTPGEIYNIGAANEWPNIEIVRLILRVLNKPESLIRYVKDRPGHDRRYAIDAGKARQELGWSAQIGFDKGLEQTIQWYLDHESWWKNVMTGEYMKYFEKNYANKMK